MRVTDTAPNAPKFSIMFSIVMDGASAGGASAPAQPNDQEMAIPHDDIYIHTYIQSHIHTYIQTVTYIHT